MRPTPEHLSRRPALLCLIIGALFLFACLGSEDGNYQYPTGSGDAGDGEEVQPQPDLVDETTDVQDEPTDELWDQWGTRGSVAGEPQSERGYAYCGMDDIRTDDVASVYESLIPEEPWGGSPIADATRRCGDDFETIIWRLMNCERMTQDLPPLRCDLRLVYLGRIHSKDMITREFFDHENPDGDDPFDRMADHGIPFSAAGENIAMHWDVEGAHWAWMDSDGHRGNILEESYFSYGGIGIIKTGAYYYLTQLFIRP